MEKIQKNEVIFYAMLLIYAAADGWRDAWLNCEWFPRHLAKWAAWYPLPIYVMWQQGFLKIENWKKVLWLAAGGFFLWEAMYMIMQ